MDNVSVKKGRTQEHERMQLELAQCNVKLATLRRELIGFLNANKIGNDVVVKDDTKSEKPVFEVGDAVSKSALENMVKKGVFFVIHEDAHPPVA